jgi:ADP-heptose:LPS heptosyltransferase
LEVDNPRIKKILVIQVGGIGDVVLTTPVFSILKKAFPKAKIDFLTAGYLKDLFTGLPELEQVLVYPKPIKSIGAIISFFLNIRKKRYDIVIDYQCTPGTAQITWFTAATFRLGWKMKRRQWAYNLWSTANTKPKYVATQKCLALQELGINEVNTNLTVYIAKDFPKIIKQYFKDEQIDTNKLIINMTPVGQVQTREWELEKYISLANLLIEKYSATIIFSGSSKDTIKLNALSARSPHKIRVLPVWPLEKFTAYLSQVDLHFSYDNGPKHLAIAVGTPTLSLFATDPPFLWNPVDHPNHPYILGDVPCKFCRLTECPLMICMESISPEQVMEKIEEIPALKNKLQSSSLANE